MLANPRANAGKARLCVNVNLCKLSLSEYGPTLPLAAALNRAYSKSKASKREYLAVMLEERRLLSVGSLALLPTAHAAAAATDVSDEVVLEDGEAIWPLCDSVRSSADVCSGDDEG